MPPGNRRGSDSQGPPPEAAPLPAHRASSSERRTAISAVASGGSCIMQAHTLKVHAVAEPPAKTSFRRELQESPRSRGDPLSLARLRTD